MKIVGNTVGMGLPKPDLRQTDPRKGDFVYGKGEIANAVNEALAQAKASGEFKGEPGEPGQPGADYVLTDADKSEIAEMAAELVDVPEGGNVDLTGYVKAPTATVGQTIKVKSVDDNGVPTAWEAVDFPSVPTKVSQLANDSGFQTESEVAAIVEEAIADIEIPSGGGGSGGEVKAELIYSFTADGETMSAFEPLLIENGGIYAIAFTVPSSTAAVNTPMVSVRVCLNAANTFTSAHIVGSISGQAAYAQRMIRQIITRRDEHVEVLANYFNVSTNISTGRYSGDNIYIYSSSADTPIIKGTTVEVYKLG